MTVAGSESLGWLGSGIRQPNCWEFFGFSGPTSRHNLDLAWRESVNKISPTGIHNAQRLAFAGDQYKKCLSELGAENEAAT